MNSTIMLCTEVVMPSGYSFAIIAESTADLERAWNRISANKPMNKKAIQKVRVERMSK